jgi:hypothetical protein
MPSNTVYKVLYQSHYFISTVVINLIHPSKNKRLKIIWSHSTLPLDKVRGYPCYLTGVNRNTAAVQAVGSWPNRDQVRPCKREGTCAVVDSVRDLLLGLLKLLDVRSAGSRFMVVLLCTQGSTSRKCWQFVWMQMTLLPIRTPITHVGTSFATVFIVNSNVYVGI